MVRWARPSWLCAPSLWLTGKGQDVGMEGTPCSVDDAASSPRALLLEQAQLSP